MDKIVRIAICDDEVKQIFLLRKAVERLLSQKNIHSTISEFFSGEALLSSDVCSYDIIFLDVEMKELNGIDTARAIRNVNNILQIVFVTGYTDYVFDGYEVNALNYIVKPFSSEKLSHVLDMALKNLEIREVNYFLLENNIGTFKIPWVNIEYFMSDKRKVHLFAKDSSYEFYGKLDDIENLTPSGFMRIHKRYLVNLSYACGIEGFELILQSGRLPISRQRMKETMISFAKTMLN